MYANYYILIILIIYHRSPKLVIFVQSDFTKSCCIWLGELFSIYFFIIFLHVR